ncbi:MAG: hypothetical protein L3K15_07765 [Thermoplasmata archaeon]|nr:hypothetical protein [Thermoplasmata archaeon]
MSCNAPTAGIVRAVESRAVHIALLGSLVLLLLIPVSALAPAPAGRVVAAPRASDHAALGSAGSSSVAALALAAARQSLAHPGGSALTATLPSWSQVTPQTPAARYAASLAYDAADHYVVLFGGTAFELLSNIYFGDTWSFSGGVWTPLAPGSSPPARGSASMVYDAVDKYVVLYGGGNATTVFSDTWEFKAGKWTQLHPLTSPGPRQSAGFAFDGNDSYAVLFGGSDGTGTPVNSTWEYVTGAWTHLITPKAPSPRIEAGVAYDAKDGWVVLFGGHGTGPKAFGDTWNFSKGHWKHLTPVTSPPARSGASMAYDTTDAKIVMFGGINVTLSGYRSDTWTFVGGVWTKVGPWSHPFNRYDAALADGPSGGTLTLFGGYSATKFNLGDTWAFHGSTWKSVQPAQPAGRYVGAMGYDEADGYVLLFGGLAASGNNLGDTWIFSHGLWKPLHPLASPPRRNAAMMTYDAADGYIVLYGGQGASGSPLGDTWSYLAGTWSEITTSSDPPARWNAAMTYDVGDGYVLLFGGYNATAGTSLSDTWTYLNGVWTQLFPGTAPSARYAAGMTYDSADGYVLLFGGYALDLAVANAETWSFVAGGWSNLTGSLAIHPAAVGFPSMADDSFVGYVLLFGGTNVSSSNTTWSFTGGLWAAENPAVAPGVRYGAPTAYDAADNLVVIFGGSPGAGVDADTWTY